MEDRIVIALALILAVFTGLAWAIARKISKRREFKIRQAGRGKNVAPVRFEPAE